MEILQQDKLLSERFVTAQSGGSFQRRGAG
jgi:hypothetical protein